MEQTTAKKIEIVGKETEASREILTARSIRLYSFDSSLV